MSETNNETIITPIDTMAFFLLLCCIALAFAFHHGYAAAGSALPLLRSSRVRRIYSLGALFVGDMDPVIDSGDQHQDATGTVMKILPSLRQTLAS